MGKRLQLRSRPVSWFCNAAGRCILATLLLLGPAAAWGLDQLKAAGNIARQAAMAFEQGDHVRAAQLYLQAYATDPNTADYVYGAARAEHIGGKLGVAEQHYVAFLEKVTSGTRADNARKYLGELRAGQADTKISEAERAERQGKFGLAAQLFRTARTLVPTRWDCLIREASAREQAGEKAEAITLLELYLRDAPKDAADRDEAGARLASLKPKTDPGKSAAAAKVAEPAKPASAVARQPEAAKTPSADPAKNAATAPQVAKAQPPEPDRMLAQVVAWSVAFVGVAAGATGIIEAVDAANMRADLDAKLAQRSGKITGISYSEAVARDKDIESQRTTAWVLGGVGVAAAATGGWLLWRAYRTEPAKVSVLPLGDGVVVTLKF